MYGIVISAGVLWFLISYFTRGTEGGSKKAFAISLIVMLCNFVLNFTLTPIIGGFSALISGAVLYFSVEWICYTSRRNTLWITGCYFVIMIIIGIVSVILSMPVDA